MENKPQLLASTTENPSPIAAVIVRENIFLWKREEHLKDANKASNNFGPPQSKDPVALEGTFGEGREGRAAFLLHVD